MKLRIAVLLALIAYAVGQASSSTNAPSTSTAAPTTPTTTTQPPPTTTKTTPPTTTTTLATTQPPKTSTAPPTTTAIPVTSTESPTPKPPPSAVTGTWGLTDDKSKYCVLLQVAMTFNVTYPMLGEKVGTGAFVLPEDATVVDYPCATDTSDNTQLFGLHWNTTEKQTFELTFTFFSAEGSQQYNLQNIIVNYTVLETGDEIFPNGVQGGYSTEMNDTLSHDSKIDKTNAYKCFSGVIQLEDGTIHYDNLQYQAFTTSSDKTTFGTIVECQDDFTTSDIVPIAVGCALAALVVIVLIAYLIGRKRSRQKGYQSV